jgi:hypothetical protein
MPAFLYRCPIVGMKVQGWRADDPSETNTERFQSVTCLACAQVHLVNPRTGKVLGEDND